MKTLSYVKQAMAVALLISAAQATAMNETPMNEGKLSKAGKFAYKLATFPITYPGSFTWQPKRDKVEGVVGQPAVKDANTQAIITPAIKAVTAVDARDHKTIAARFAESYVGTKLAGHDRIKGTLLVVGSALVYYAGFKLVVAAYKKLFGTSTEEVVTEEPVEIQEEAEPVVVAEEQQQPAKVAPKKIKLRQPVA